MSEQDKLLDKYKSSGFDAFIENGVVMVRCGKENESAAKKILKEMDYRYSYGFRYCKPAES